MPSPVVSHPRPQKGFLQPGTSHPRELLQAESASQAGADAGQEKHCRTTADARADHGTTRRHKEALRHCGSYDRENWRETARTRLRVPAMRPATDPATNPVVPGSRGYRRLRPSNSLPAPNGPDLRNADPARVMKIERDDPLLTVAQAGDYLGTGERFVRRLITQRRITYVKIGKFVRLPRSALDDFIEAGRVLGEEPPR